MQTTPVTPLHPSHALDTETFLDLNSYAASPHGGLPTSPNQCLFWVGMRDEISPKTTTSTTTMPLEPITSSHECRQVRARENCRSHLRGNFFLGSDGHYHPAGPDWKVRWIHNNQCHYYIPYSEAIMPMVVYRGDCQSTTPAMPHFRRLEVTAEAEAEAKAKLDISLYALSNLPEMSATSTGGGEHLRMGFDEVESRGRQLSGSCNKICHAGLTCTQLSQRGVSCIILEKLYHCDCSGCPCAGCALKQG